VTSGNIVYEPSAGRPPWVFVACERFIAMVDGGAPQAAIDSLWALTEVEDVAIEDLVGAVPIALDARRASARGSDARGTDAPESRGPDAPAEGVGSFAIVRFADASPVAADRSVTVVARGRACVDVYSVGVARRFGSGGVEPWMLAGFRSVTALGLHGDDLPARSVPVLPERRLGIRQATVPGERMLWSHPTAVVSVDTGSPAAVVSVETQTAAAIGAQSASFAAPAVEDDPVLPEDLDRTVLRTDRRVASARHSVGSVPDDDTVLLSRSGTRSAPAEHEPAPPAPARFALSVGAAAPLTLTGPVVFGRRPAGPRAPVPNPPALVTVPSPHEIVSSSHVRIEPQGGTVVVTDLRSTNGTFVTVPGQRRRRIHPGESFVVPHDASIDIGDGNIIEITPIVRDRLSGRPETAAGGPR
jgi:hypothetical protein